MGNVSDPVKTADLERFRISMPESRRSKGAQYVESRRCRSSGRLGRAMSTALGRASSSSRQADRAYVTLVARPVSSHENQHPLCGYNQSVVEKHERVDPPRAAVALSPLTPILTSATDRIAPPKPCPAFPRALTVRHQVSTARRAADPSGATTDDSCGTRRDVARPKPRPLANGFSATKKFRGVGASN